MIGKIVEKDTSKGGEEGRTEPSDFSSGKNTNCLLQSMADVIKRYLCVSFSDFRWSFLMR